MRACKIQGSSIYEPKKRDFQQSNLGVSLTTTTRKAYPKLNKNTISNRAEFVVQAR